ncbi:MAG: hypothetical protein HY866_00310 [Chloroflexi bacterium]|nr:hypothetical protein [Chloroflexota bacterium]
MKQWLFISRRTLLSRLPFVISLVMLALLLTGCVSAPMRDAYTAAGDGTKPAELQKTGTFAADDDLNVVVRLNTHSRSLNLSAIFTSSTGDVFSTDTIEADETVGEVLLGLDWETRGNVYWPSGEWKVEVYVDEIREKTLTFTVAAAAQPTATPAQ